MIYGKNNVFDAERLVDLLSAFESFKSASLTARGNLASSDTAKAENASAFELFPGFWQSFGNRRPSPALLPTPFAFLSDRTENGKLHCDHDTTEEIETCAHQMD